MYRWVKLFLYPVPPYSQLMHKFDFDPRIWWFNFLHKSRKIFTTLSYQNLDLKNFENFYHLMKRIARYAQTRKKMIIAARTNAQPRTVYSSNPYDLVICSPVVGAHTPYWTLTNSWEHAHPPIKGCLAVLASIEDMTRGHYAVCACLRRTLCDTYLRDTFG